MTLLIRTQRITVFNVNTSNVLTSCATQLFGHVNLPTATLGHANVNLTRRLVTLRHNSILVVVTRGSTRQRKLAALHRTEQLKVPIVLLAGTLSSHFDGSTDVIVRIPHKSRGKGAPLRNAMLLYLRVVI